MEEHGLGETVRAQTALFDEQGWIMRGGSIVDATIIAAPSSTKNATGQQTLRCIRRRRAASGTSG